MADIFVLSGDVSISRHSAARMVAIAIFNLKQKKKIHLFFTVIASELRRGL